MDGKEAIKVCDEQLWMENYLRGDPRAFEMLIERYKAYVFAIIFHFVKNPEDAQDIAQEVFLQLYRSRPEYRPDRLKAWIGRIAANKAIDWKRKRLGRPEREDIPLELSSIPDQTDSGPEQLLLKREQEARIKDLCQTLPPRYRRVILKYHFENKSYQQIAREEGISLKTVESRLYRARKFLRERWEEGSE
ncbi:MAG TPA: RNA polymerase subunit sigma-24 [Ruminiclostridium sp.]|jgi:RNA polymerase sigma factor (sigma-70 family)|nr:RNA polymerase subunit sigma-24 [Ruminiclostridium sp.]